MKKIICVVCHLLVLSLVSVWGQQLTPPTHPSLARFGTPVPSADPPKLTEFDLDFPGGTPADLVKAIEAATGKPLNVIIPPEDANTQLPPLKMSDVNVPQLFDALREASQQFGPYSQFGSIQDGFRTPTEPVTDTSIWYFFAQAPVPLVGCKFYQLQPYLNRGFTVDDITTAIQTGWKMAGITSPPELNYHRETNLLIAFGKPNDLAIIQNVLDTLPQSYFDRVQVNYLLQETRKIDRLESQIDQLEKKVSALTGSTTNNAGK